MVTRTVAFQYSFIATLLAAIGLVGCMSHVSQQYVATKNVILYSEPSDGLETEEGIVRKGEKCVAGEERIMKAYRFVEMTCPTVRGWTPNWYDFEPIKTTLFNHTKNMSTQ
jgi:hypothetical protein